MLHVVLRASGGTPAALRMKFLSHRPHASKTAHDPVHAMKQENTLKRENP
jgi:hypothetical protein